MYEIEKYCTKPGADPDFIQPGKASYIGLENPLQTALKCRFLQQKPIKTNAL